MHHIALIVTNNVLAGRMARHLEVEGFSIAVLTNLSAVKGQLRSQPTDIIVLDLNESSTSGFELLKQIRAEYIATPIVVLNASDDEADMLDAFKLGADDYLHLPLKHIELTERIRAKLRRRLDGIPVPIRAGMLEVDPARRTVTVGADAISLAPKEFDVLYALMRARGQVVTAEQLLAEVWGIAAKLETRTVDYHVRQVRHKLKPFGFGTAVVTVPRRGYAWRPPA
jgi:DNA-binding response OmpR family regulator